MENKITQITRNEIFSFLIKGEINGLSLIHGYGFYYYGRLTCAEFLSRLYDLQEMPSRDSKMKNALEEIRFYTNENSKPKYPYGWIFCDDRFPLVKGSDEQLLDFLCEMFYPNVRNNDSNWRYAFLKINELLRNDGYEFCIKGIESNNAVYGWRRVESKHQITKIDEINSLIAIFNKNGFVLDFSRSDFDNFSYKLIGLNIVSFYGLSGGKSLQAFIDEAKESDVIKLLVALFDRYSNVCSEEEKKEEKYLHNKSIIERWRKESTTLLDAVNFIQTEIVCNLEQRFSSEYMAKQISLMQSTAKENPTECIGKAKEIIESCCKTILEERAVKYDVKLSLTKLVSMCRKTLRVTPQDIDDDVPEADSIRTVLGSLSTIVENINTLRNTYGGGHGKPASYKGLEERHARLAMGCCITLVDFLWTTHERTK